MNSPAPPAPERPATCIRLSSTTWRARRAGAALAGAAAALPLAGAWAAGRITPALFAFPPPPYAPAAYPRFRWAAAALVLAPLAAAGLSWARSRPPAPPAGGGAPGRMPRWAYPAFAWTLAWWVLAWTRLPWFAPAQVYTFFPLWLGFIVSANALAFRRTGTCLMLRAPGLWAALFGASAAFWWLFEWLNRFVANWHYLGVERFGALGYAVHATLCFSTVLPAVAAASEWLGSHGGWRARCAAGPAWRWLARPATGGLLAAGAAAALVVTGAAPREAYPALWTAPLALALGEGILAGRPGIAGEIAAGDWRRAGTWAVAALLCGGFWELWNWRSLAHWVYTVPYADRWHLFAMPLLGYAGYLPFGLECLVVCDRLFGLKRLEPTPAQNDSLPERRP